MSERSASSAGDSGMPTHAVPSDRVPGLAVWIRAGVLENAAVQVASTFAADEPIEVALALALAVEAVRESDTCIDLDHVRTRFTPSVITGSEEEPTLPWPGDDWADILDRSPLVELAADVTNDSARHNADDLGDSTGTGLLVREGSLVFLRRLWLDERDLDASLRQLHNQTPKELSPDSAAFIDAIFADVPASAAEAPRAAVNAALTRSLTVVTGGPGTGKTWTLARMLAAIWHRDPLTKVSLTAPTGKAAKRMKDAIDSARTSLDLGPELTEQFAATEPATLHRFLGLRPGNAPRYNQDNRVDADVVVVDEASMVSLPLMAQLVRALPETVTLLLLGDPFQLASVEAGSVLGDLVAPESAVADSVVHLTINHRSIPDLDELFRAVNDGDADAVVGLLSQANSHFEGTGEVGSMQWIPIDNAPDRSTWSSVLSTLLNDRTLEPLVTHAKQSIATAVSDDAVAAVNHSVAIKVLCATHRGSFGVDAWTESIEALLLPKRARHVEWYPGRPVMITRNDYVNGLFNGDTGITVDGQVVVIGETGEDRKFAPESLSDVVTWWAMSIHKSQGSEFDHVVVSFEAPRNSSSVVSRELLYTALTRARSNVTIVASEAAIRWAVEHEVVRFSGLGRRLAR